MLSSQDLSSFVAGPNRPELEFLVVCKDNPVFQSVAAAIHQVKGRLNCAPSAATARDYVSWRKVDGIVIDMNLPGAVEVIRRVRGGNPNRFSAVFACIGSSPETQVAIGAGANFVLHRPLLPDKIARVLAAAADMMVAEKRHHLRYPLMVPVELRMKEREVESTMSNLSEGGMAIWSLYYYRPGSAIQFAFEIPFGGLVRGDGEVAWTNADGLAGIKFRSLCDQASAHLSAWIARRNPEN
ncbi:MAG TPA: PilZ domain-containing protein [Candidatus Angelobacter sp.]